MVTNGLIHFRPKSLYYQFDFPSLIHVNLSIVKQKKVVNDFHALDNASYKEEN